MHWISWCLLLLCWGGSRCSDPPPDGQDGELDGYQADSHTKRSPPPVEPLDFGFVPSAVYATHAYYEPGAMGILFHVVHAFLYVVQPNPFPKDLIVRVIQENKGRMKLEEWRKVGGVYYEAGFLVCGSLGLLFLVLVPIVGTCFCVCRCCDNCGGEMHQRQRKNADCQRGFFTASLIVTSIFIILGVLFAYAANHNISNQIKSTRRLVNTNMRDLKTFANNTPAQIDYLTAQYTTAKNKVLSDLDNIGPVLGGRIHSQLEREVMPSLDTALRMAGAMRETKEALESIGSSLDTLQEGTVRLQLSLSNERASLSNTLSDPACTNGAVSHTCNTIRSTLGQLGSSADFSTLPDVSRQLMNVDALLKTDLSNIIQKGYSSFNDTPRLVKEQTKNIVAGVKVMLDRIGGEIVDFAKMFPVEASLANFTIFLNQGQQQIESYYAQIDQLDFYRWIGCVAALCMVVLIVCFNLLGLLCGSCGYDKQATPTNRGCLSNTGGNLLMAGVGFSFLFAWALMAVVSSLFVVGGNVEKLICEPLANRQLFQIIDTPYIMHPGMKNFLPNMLFQNPNIDLTVGGMYRECHENYGLYHALQLETMFNINSFLNRTVYNKDLANVFESIHVQLQDVSLLEQEGRDALISFANSGVGEIDFTAYLTEANKAVTLVDLLSFATDLEAQADQLPRGALENALKGHASSIRQINKDQVVPLQQAMVRTHTLSQSVRLLQKTVSDLPVQVTNVLSAIDAAEYLITNNASHVIKQETNGYMQMLVGYFRQYTKWVKSSLSAEVAQCKPISNIVDSMEIVGCSFIVDSVNTFWFGLGGCLVLLIPSIILSVKLSKYYRRMDTEDVFDE
uniref:Prominin 1 b n=1 Tax=Gadus morhua TaxID=8049 RepID=A0A8C4YUZ9_GADMO